MKLQTPVEEIENITAVTAKELRKLGINTISDLLLYFPSRHEDFSEVSKIAETKEGQQVSIKAVIKTIKPFFRFGKSLPRAEGIVSDESGSMKVVWFNQAYLASAFHVGDELFLSGIIRDYKGLQMQNPIYEMISESMEQIHTA